MCPVSSGSSVCARKGSQVIPGTGPSFGLQGDKKVLKTARGSAFIKVLLVPFKAYGTPWKAQTLSSQSLTSSLVTKQVMSPLMCFLIFMGRTHRQSSVTKGIGEGTTV